MADLVNALAVAGKSALGFQAIFFALLAIGINVQFGYAGLLNFGQIAFAMMGGFGIAISVSKWGLNFWVGVLIGVAAAVVLFVLRLPFAVCVVGGAVVAALLRLA